MSETVDFTPITPGGSTGTWGAELNVILEALKAGANTALTNAGTALSTATSASSLASDAASTASSALGAASAAETAATNAEAAADDAEAAATAAAAAVDGKAEDDEVVHLAGEETITGAKTFTTAPVVPDGSFTIAKTTGLQTALDGKSASTHNHDDRYYTETEIDAKVSARVETHPTGTSVPGGTPDGTLWVEYTP